MLSRTAGRLSIGALPAVFLKLLGADESDFSAREMLVLDAIRRSTSALSDASIDEIAAYLRSMSPKQLLGFRNNVKGIYHELRYVEHENADGDELEADLFELTNHPGADVVLASRLTGERTEIQLKATDSTHYVREHQETFPAVNVLATEEVASRVDGVESSGMRNAELEDETQTMMERLAGDGDLEPASGLLSAAMHAGATLRGEAPTSAASRKVLENLGIGAGSAVLLDILIG